MACCTYDSELGCCLAARCVVVFAVLYPSLSVSLGSHVKTTQSPASSTRLARLSMFLIVVGDHCVAFRMAVSAASASVRYLHSDIAFVFQPFRSSQAAAAPNLASFAAFVNRVICYGRSGSMLFGTCEYPEVRITGLASETLSTFRTRHLILKMRLEGQFRVEPEAVPIGRASVVRKTLLANAAPDYIFCCLEEFTASAGHECFSLADLELDCILGALDSQLP